MLFFQTCSNLYKQYLVVMRLFNLTQLNSEATRITWNASSLIDHVLSNTCENICQSVTINTGLSDHICHTLPGRLLGVKLISTALLKLGL